MGVRVQCRSKSCLSIVEETLAKTHIHLLMKYVEQRNLPRTTKPRPTDKLRKPFSKDGRFSGTKRVNIECNLAFRYIRSSGGNQTIPC